MTPLWCRRKSIMPPTGARFLTPGWIWPIRCFGPNRDTPALGNPPLPHTGEHGLIQSQAQNSVTTTHNSNHQHQHKQKFNNFQNHTIHNQTIHNTISTFKLILCIHQKIQYTDSTCILQFTNSEQNKTASAGRSPASDVRRSTYHVWFTIWMFHWSTTNGGHFCITYKKLNW